MKTLFALVTAIGLRSIWSFSVFTCRIRTAPWTFSFSSLSITLHHEFVKALLSPLGLFFLEFFNSFFPSFSQVFLVASKIAETNSIEENSSWTLNRSSTIWTNQNSHLNLGSLIFFFQPRTLSQMSTKSTARAIIATENKRRVSKSIIVSSWVWFSESLPTVIAYAVFHFLGSKPASAPLTLNSAWRAYLEYLVVCDLAFGYSHYS